MKLLKFAFILIGFASFAQGKVGAVDVEFILANMPEMTEVQEKLETYAGTLDMDLNKKLGEFNEKMEAYTKGEASFTPEKKKEEQEKLLEMERDIQRYQQNGARLMELKQQEFLQPLYQKIETALEKVAKTQNFTQVNQITPNMVYLDPAYDLTEAILKEMNITLKSE